MFKYNIRGENIEVTEAIRQYAEKKISKLEKYFTDVANATVYVNLKVYTEKTAKVEGYDPTSLFSSTCRGNFN